MLVGSAATGDQNYWYHYFAHNMLIYRFLNVNDCMTVIANKLAIEKDLLEINANLHQ